MPTYHKLVILDPKKIPLRKFGGSKEAVETEFYSLSPIKWHGCEAVWKTRKDRSAIIRSFRVFQRKRR